MSLFNFRFFIIALGLVAGLVSTLALSACGYRPLYGTSSLNPTTEANLAAIEISPLYERTGQMLHTELSRRLYPRAQAQITTHTLLLKLSEGTQHAAIARNTAATRANFTLRTEFQLVRKSDSREVFKGSLFSTVSYNILASDYSNMVAADDARERAVKDTSEQLARRMASYFNIPENLNAQGQTAK